MFESRLRQVEKKISNLPDPEQLAEELPESCTVEGCFLMQLGKDYSIKGCLADNPCRGHLTVSKPA